MKRIMKKQFRIAAFLLIGLALLGALLLWLVQNGVIILNRPPRDRYPIRGVDVSTYQGEIDWPTLVAQNIDFAFIKATEGSSFTDPRFAYNYAAAQKTGIPIGAYHFFSFESGGDTQAENFIKNVSPFSGMLPPVIDLELYGVFTKQAPETEAVRYELNRMLSALEIHYGIKPMLYTTEDCYKRYLANDYEDYDIWIRNILCSPSLSAGRAWTFWQYTSRERLDGYQGKETFIDMNVFYGNSSEWESYLMALTHS